MKPDQQPEAAVFQAAAQLAGSLRAAFLDSACQGDPALRQRLEALLAAHDAQNSPVQPKELEPEPIRGSEKTTVRVTPQESPDEVIGRKFGRYKILEKIGEGGGGVVYVAEQTEPVRRRVALKVIKLGMDTKQVVARFEAERQALAMMDHPNIARVLDAGATDSGRPYFVMELVRGIRLTDYCDQNKLSTHDRLDLFTQVCRAIQHAHQKGIIHRDIKPSNILVTLHDGVPVPKVIDFGIAKATEGRLTDATVYTQLHQFIGTPAYMSPEQAEMSGLDVDTRSDIYSLGVLLYELLTGKTPFDGRELVSQGIDAMRRTIREKEPLRPSTKLGTLQGDELTTTAKRRSVETSKLARLLRGDLDWIVMKCLEKDRTRRYETANGVVADIQRHLKNEPIVARPPSRLYEFQKTVRRHRFGFAAAAALILVLAVGVLLSTQQAVRATRAEKLAAKRLLDSEKARADAEAISAFLRGVFQSPDPTRDGRSVTVADTLGRAVKKLETDLANQPSRRADLQATLGLTYFGLGLYREAIPLQEKVRDYVLARFGLEHTNTLDVMNNLALSYFNAGRQDESLKLREDVLNLRRKLQGPEHTNTLAAMVNLVQSYDRAGRRNEARKLQEDVLAAYRKVTGPESRDTIKAMGNLAYFYYSDTGPSEQTLNLQKEVLALSRKVNGPEHPYTLTALENLATYSAAGSRRDEALRLREEVLPLKRKVLGPEHPATLGAMLNLALSYSDVGRTPEAVSLGEEVVALRRKISGAEHFHTLGAMTCLATFYDQSGRWADALKLQTEALELNRKINGPEHPMTLEMMRTLASIHYSAGHWDTGIKLLEEVVPLLEKVNGPEQPDTLTAMGGLASCYAGAGRTNEALALREKVLALDRKALGAENPATLLAAVDLASSYSIAGRTNEAQKLFDEALPLFLKVNGPTHPDTLKAMNKQASFFFTAGRHDEALKLREEVLALRRKALGPEHPDTLETMTDLAVSLNAARRLADAVQLQEPCLAIERRVLPPGHPRLRAALENLADLYDKTGHAPQAQVLRQELADLRGKTRDG